MFCQPFNGTTASILLGIDHGCLQKIAKISYDYVIIMCLLFAHVITHTIYFMIRCWFFSYCSLQVFIHFRVSVTCKIKSSADLLRSNVHLFSFSLSLIHNRYLRSIPSAYEMCSLYCTFGQFLLSMKAHETAILLHIFLNVVNMFNQTQ